MKETARHELKICPSPEISSSIPRVVANIFFFFDSKRVYCTRVTLGHKRTELVQNAKGPGQRASGTVLVVRKVVIFPADLGEVTFRVY